MVLGADCTRGAHRMLPQDSVADFHVRPATGCTAGSEDSNEEALGNSLDLIRYDYGTDSDEDSTNLQGLEMLAAEVFEFTDMLELQLGPDYTLRLGASTSESPDDVDQKVKLLAVAVEDLVAKIHSTATSGKRTSQLPPTEMNLLETALKGLSYTLQYHIFRDIATEVTSSSTANTKSSKSDVQGRWEIETNPGKSPVEEESHLKMNSSSCSEFEQRCPSKLGIRKMLQMLTVLVDSENIWRTSSDRHECSYLMILKSGSRFPS